MEAPNVVAFFMVLGDKTEVDAPQSWFELCVPYIHPEMDRTHSTYAFSIPSSDLRLAQIAVHPVLLKINNLKIPLLKPLLKNK